MRAKTLWACASALTAMLAASAAAAQTYDRLVVFGDSLSDNGNFSRLVGGAPPAPPSPPYFQGRFSNGPVFTELLGFNLQPFGATAGSVNNAFGFARTDLQTTPPSLQVQLNAYLAAGGQFGPRDLVTVYGGANDIFQGIAPAAVSANPAAAIGATATGAAANIGLIVNRVAGAGAGTILSPNLPGLGTTPAFAGGPAQPLADLATITYNAAHRAQLFAAAAANPNTNIVLVDIDRAYAYLRANPAAFGVTNVTTPCLNTTTGTLCATPDTFLFWDEVHPTATGHRFFAATTLDYAFYGARGAATATQGEAALDHREGALDAALGHLDAEMDDVPALTLTIEGGEGSEDARGDVPDVDRSSLHLRAAIAHRMTATLAGGVLLSVSDSDVDAGALSFNARSLAADGFLGWRSGGMFVNGVVGLSAEEYDDIRRLAGVGVVAHTAGRVDGHSYGGKLQAGWRGQFGGATVSPRAAISAVHVEVDPYGEDGPIARHAVQAREVETVAAEAALRFEAPLGGFASHLEAGYGDFLSYDGDVTTALVDNPARPITLSIEEPGRGFLLNTGLRGRVMGGWELGAGYRGRFDDGSDSHAALVSLTLRQ
jgi:outer membrane lipase/esterase